MHTSSPILATLALLLVTAAPASLAAHSVQPILNTQLPYPAEVSLVQEAQGWTFRQSPTNLPLYLYEPRLSGATACDSACRRQWIPLLAPAGEKPLGDWTIVVRKDGRQQWAFEQHPVYLHRHDGPDRPSGGSPGPWHLMPHFRAAAHPPS
jgi:predicted lipoprotein with Yx(FWY)xxD motif